MTQWKYKRMKWNVRKCRQYSNYFIFSSELMLDSCFVMPAFHVIATLTVCFIVCYHHCVDADKQIIKRLKYSHTTKNDCRNAKSLIDVFITSSFYFVMNDSIWFSYREQGDFASWTSIVSVSGWSRTVSNQILCTPKELPTSKTKYSWVFVRIFKTWIEMHF